MDKQAILKAIEKFSQAEHLLGTFAKIIGTDPGGQTISMLMVFGKANAATAEEAYALYLLDDTNTDQGIYHSVGKTYHTILKPKVVIGNDKTVGRGASWQDVEYVQSHLSSEGLHIPLEAADTGKLEQEDIVQSYSVGDATSMTIVAETQTAFIVMYWVTFT